MTRGQVWIYGLQLGLLQPCAAFRSLFCEEEKRSKSRLCYQPNENKLEEKCQDETPGQPAAAKDARGGSSSETACLGKGGVRGGSSSIAESAAPTKSSSRCNTETGAGACAAVQQKAAPLTPSPSSRATRVASQRHRKPNSNQRSRVSESPANDHQPKASE